jgi:hypothetical protein
MIRTLFAAALLVSLPFAASAKKFPLASTSTVPAARGEIETDNDRNGNTKVKLKVEHLANPHSLTPPAVDYVVWFQQEGEPENQGRLRVNDDLKGEIEVTTGFKNFRVFVTAEPEVTGNRPTGPEVLSATVQP